MDLFKTYSEGQQSKASISASPTGTGAAPMGAPGTFYGPPEDAARVLAVRQEVAALRRACAKALADLERGKAARHDALVGRRMRQTGWAVGGYLLAPLVRAAGVALVDAIQAAVSPAPLPPKPRPARTMTPAQVKRMFERDQARVRERFARDQAKAKARWKESIR